MTRLILFIVILVSLSITGCDRFVRDSGRTLVPVRDNVFHPPLPEALDEPSIEYKIITPEVVAELEGTDYVLVALVWSDYLSLGQYMKEINKKFGEYTTVLCYYRRDAGDHRCKAYATPQKDSAPPDP